MRTDTLIVTIICAIISFRLFSKGLFWIWLSIALLVIGGCGAIGNAIQLVKTGRDMNLQILLICLLMVVCGVVCVIKKVL